MIPLQFRVKLTSIRAWEKNEKPYFFLSFISNGRWSRHTVFSKWKSEQCPFDSLLCPRIRWKPKYHSSLYKTNDQFLTISTFLTYSFISFRQSYYSKIFMPLLKARTIFFSTMYLVTIIDWVSAHENTSKTWELLHHHPNPTNEIRRLLDWKQTVMMICTYLRYSTGNFVTLLVLTQPKKWMWGILFPIPCLLLDISTLSST